MNKLLVLFNHELTNSQRDDTRKNLGVGDKIIIPPDNIKKIWAQIPADTEEIVSFLADIRKWLQKAGSKDDFVLVQGDFGASHLMVEYARMIGLVPVYATTEREAVEEHEEDGTVKITHRFKHIRFRRYVNPYATIDTAPTQESREEVSWDELVAERKPALDRLKEIFSEVRKYGTWGQRGEEKINDLRREVTEKYPDSLTEFNKTLGNAQKAGGILNSCYNLAAGGIKSKTAKKLAEKYNLDLNRVNEDELLGFLKTELKESGFGGLCYKAGKQFLSGKMAAARAKQEKKIFKNGSGKKTVTPRHQQVSKTKNYLIEEKFAVKSRPLSLPSAPLHANDIRGLSPGTRWELLLDETGSDFTNTAQSRSDKKGELGRMVGLLVPAVGVPLAKLPKGWHATEVKDPQEISRVVQNILDGRCGVFGLSVKSLHLTRGDRWAQLAQAVIEWVVRLVPINGDTSIEVLIEQRGEYERGQNWKLMADVIKHSLANTFPERAKHIKLSIKTIAKNDHHCNGYVDAVAYTWAQSTPMSSCRLEDSQFAGTCLFSVDAALLLDNWNRFHLGGEPDTDSWGELVGSKDAGASTGMVSTLLDAIGNECRANTELWSRYLHHCKSHVTGKAINLDRLGREIDWLERFKPDGMKIPAQLRLSWLTVKLAGANHYGDTEAKWLTELEELSVRLYVEDAPLVCHADLHRAVQQTNRFAFARASEALSIWQDCDPAIPGLRYHGQVQSSLGQHAAFMGRTDEAIRCFDGALAAFQKLCDGGVRDCTQTGIYKLIVMMDSDKYTDKEVLAEFVSLGEGLDFEKDVFSSKAAENKYIHHVLLRYLVTRGNPALIDRYLAHRDDWQSEAGHPWQLIQAYRALLLFPHDREKALQTMNDGAALAFSPNQGPTVRLIGACLRAISHGWGDRWEESGQVLIEINQTLPFAEHSVNTIKEFIATPGDERNFIAETLPFNFR